MPDLLLELLSEEIPARMQARAAEDLRKAVTDRLVDAGLVYDGAKTFVTPRRLALAVQGVPVRQPDRREEKKGPRVGAPEPAIAGFLKAAGLKSLADLPASLVGPLFQNAQLLERAIEEGLAADGTFTAINNRVSQSVPHMHIHLVPRHFKDGLKGFFWPRQRYQDEAAMRQVQDTLSEALARLRSRP